MKTKILIFSVVATFLATLNVSAQEPTTTIALDDIPEFLPKQKRNQFGFNLGLGAAIMPDSWGPNISIGARWLRNGDSNLAWNVLNLNMHTFVSFSSDSYLIFEMIQLMTGIHFRADRFYFALNAGPGLAIRTRYNVDDYGTYAQPTVTKMGVVFDVGAGFYLTKKFYMGAYFNSQTLIDDGTINFVGLKLGWDF